MNHLDLLLERERERNDESKNKAKNEKQSREDQLKEMEHKKR
jgi:hypothetical protein